MPLYEYRCAACDVVSEINHRMSDSAPTDCPICGASQLAKQISAAGFRLKGAGWYETDFKSDGKKNLAGDSGAEAKPAGEGKSDVKSEPKAESKFEAKPDAKAEAKPAAKTESKPAAAPSTGSTPG